MRRLLVLIAAVVLAASACSSDGPLQTAALTVSGQVVVTQAELDDELAFLADEPELAQALVGPVEGEAPGSYSPAAAAQLLNLHALSALFIRVVDADPDVAITEADRSVGSDQFDQTFAPVDQATGLPDESLLTEVPESLRSALVDLIAAQVALERSFEPPESEPLPEPEPVTDEQVREAYDQRFAELVEVGGDFTCVSHILAAYSDDLESLRDPAFQATTDQQDAALAEIQALDARLEAGEEFAAVAIESSDDVASGAEGGDLGCTQPGQFVPEFEEAAAELEPGEVSEPVQTDFGYHLLQVRSRGIPPFEEVEADLRTQLEGEAAQTTQAAQQEAQQAELEGFFRFLGERVQALDLEVDVDPRYGTWAGIEPLLLPDPQNPQQEGGVIPPEGAQEPAGEQQPLPVDPLGQPQPGQPQPGQPQPGQPQPGQTPAQP